MSDLRRQNGEYTTQYDPADAYSYNGHHPAGHRRFVWTPQELSDYHQRLISNSLSGDGNQHHNGLSHSRNDTHTLPTSVVSQQDTFGFRPPANGMISQYDPIFFQEPCGSETEDAPQETQTTPTINIVKPNSKSYTSFHESCLTFTAKAEKICKLVPKNTRKDILNEFSECHEKLPAIDIEANQIVLQDAKEHLNLILSKKLEEDPRINPSRKDARLKGQIWARTLEDEVKEKNEAGEEEEEDGKEEEELDFTDAGLYFYASQPQEPDECATGKNWLPTIRRPAEIYTPSHLDYLVFSRNDHQHQNDSIGRR